MLDNAGIDLRQPESSASGQTGRGGAFAAMSQDQGTKLEGLMVSVQGHVANIDRVAEDTGAKMSRAESLLQKIEENTGVSAGTLKELEDHGGEDAARWYKDEIKWERLTDRY